MDHLRSRWPGQASLRLSKAQTLHRSMIIRGTDYRYFGPWAASSRTRYPSIPSRLPSETALTNLSHQSISLFSVSLQVRRARRIQDLLSHHKRKTSARKESSKMYLTSLPVLGAAALLFLSRRVHAGENCLNVALSAVPSCAQPCYLEGAPTIGCDGLDFACQCAKQAAMFAAIEGCVADKCPAAEVEGVIDGSDKGTSSLPCTCC